MTQVKIKGILPAAVREMRRVQKNIIGHMFQKFYLKTTLVNGADDELSGTCTIVARHAFGLTTLFNFLFLINLLKHIGAQPPTPMSGGGGVVCCRNDFAKIC